jgi:hypothetical protein
MQKFRKTENGQASNAGLQCIFLQAKKFAAVTVGNEN